MSSKSLSLLVDRIRYTILKAPDRFPPDTGMSLSKCFDDIFNQIDSSSELLKDKTKDVKNLAQQALEGYEDGDVKKGIKCLQEIDILLRHF